MLSQIGFSRIFLIAAGKIAGKRRDTGRVDVMSLSVDVESGTGGEFGAAVLDRAAEHFHPPMLAEEVLLKMLGSQIGFMAALVGAFEMSLVLVGPLMST